MNTTHMLLMFVIGFIVGVSSIFAYAVFDERREQKKEFLESVKAASAYQKHLEALIELNTTPKQKFDSKLKNLLS